MRRSYVALVVRGIKVYTVPARREVRLPSEISATALGESGSLWYASVDAHDVNRSLRWIGVVLSPIMKGIRYVIVTLLLVV